MPALHFLGAAQTVTGSRFLLDTGSARVLVDCGMFQGRRALRRRNWEPFPVDPAGIDAVVISHAHLDHVGFLPVVVRGGFAGSVHCTTSTAGLADVVLRDSARIQEADAERANRKGYTKHSPALPLYTEEDAVEALSRFRPLAYGERRLIADGVWLTLSYAGHILGSATVALEMDGGATVCMSGDLGRPRHPVLVPPAPPMPADALLVESTYGDEEHVEEDGTAALGTAVAETLERGGSVVIPAFAVDRTEVILSALRELTEAGTIPRVPVFLDSPMARAALAFYQQAVIDGHPEVRPEVVGDAFLFDPGELTITESVDDSKAINHVRRPHVVISASGMATGGRVLHHLKRVLPHRRNTVVLVGYQAPGTRGSTLLAGADDVRIHGEDIPVRAQIRSVPAFSVHADRSELLDWLGAGPEPGKVLPVHGEPDASAALAEAIRARFGWDVTVPMDGDRVEF